MPKKYFWIKLKDNFFNQLAIKKLRKVAGGDTFVIIYLKMMLLSMNQEGKISYECENDEFVSNLSLEIDEDEENVNLTLAFLKTNKLIEFINDFEAFLPAVPECLGSETEWARKKRDYRLNIATKNALLGDGAGTNKGHCPSNVRQEIDIDIDIDKDKEKKAYAPLILLTETEYNRLVAFAGQEATDEAIFSGNTWKQNNPSKAKGRKSDYLFIRNWLKSDMEKKPKGTDTDLIWQEVVNRLHQRWSPDGWSSPELLEAVKRIGFTEMGLCDERFLEVRYKSKLIKAYEELKNAAGGK